MYWLKEDLERQHRQAARALSDAAVGDLPAVVAAREKLARAQASYDAAQATVPQVDTGDLDERISSARARAADLTKNLPELAYSDLLAGDLDMTSATAARAEITRLELLATDLDAARNLWYRREGTRNMSAAQAGAGLRAAREALTVATFAAKLDVVRDEAARKADAERTARLARKAEAAA
ncbi:hypothetical protein ACKVEX_14165 [Rhodocyclaceae bacterium SMB388]